MMRKRDLKSRQSSENAAANRYRKNIGIILFLIVLLTLVFRYFVLQISGYGCGSLRVFSKLSQRNHIYGVIG